MSEFKINTQPKQKHKVKRGENVVLKICTSKSMIPHTDIENIQQAFAQPVCKVPF